MRAGGPGTAVEISTSGIVNIHADTGFRRRLDALGVGQVARCMQCMRCGSGCPAAFAMDLTPPQVIRMAALGLREQVLSCKTIWVCSSCVTCTARCPMEIDVAGVMDALKEIAIEDGYTSPERDTKLFHDTFIGVLRARGRINEPILLGNYKLKSLHLMDDVPAGLEMIKKGKIKYTPKVRGRKDVRKIIDRARKKP